MSGVPLPHMRLKYSKRIAALVGPTIVAMLLFLKAVEILGPERTGAMIALVPVLAGVAAAPLLGEPLTAPLLAGLAFVSAGAFTAARPLPNPTRSQPCPT